MQEKFGDGLDSGESELVWKLKCLQESLICGEFLTRTILVFIGEIYYKKERKKFKMDKVQIKILITT